MNDAEVVEFKFSPTTLMGKPREGDITTTHLECAVLATGKCGDLIWTPSNLPSGDKGPSVGDLCVLEDLVVVRKLVQCGYMTDRKSAGSRAICTARSNLSTSVSKYPPMTSFD